MAVPIVTTSPVADHLMTLSERAREQVNASVSPQFAWNTSSVLTNQFTTMTSYHPVGDSRQVTPMQAQPARWARQPYSRYQRGQDWPHQRGKEGQWSCGAPSPFSRQESYFETENLPQPIQSNLIAGDQRNLVNPPQKLFAEQSRPSVIKSVKSMSPVDKINLLPVDSDKTALIIKYIHKKFSWETLTLSSLHQPSNVPSDKLSYVPWDVITYLAEDVPYMEERKNVFVKAWYEINMGEKLVANWIAFARDNVPLSRDFHMMAHNQQM